MSISSTKCELCEIAQSKYRCPGCQMKTCSLACSKRHKEERGCSGEREMTAFISMHDFDDLNLMSDYRFLEKTETKVSDSSRVDKRRGHIVFKPKFLQILEKQARKRGTVFLVMPTVFKRHASNKSYFDIKQQMIEWTIEWVFNKGSLSCYQHKVSEKSTPLEALRNFLLSSSCSPEVTSQISEISDAPDEELAFFFYHVKKFKSVVNRYEPIEKREDLINLFAGKTIVEHPTIHVVQKSDWARFPPQNPVPSDSA